MKLKIGIIGFGRIGKIHYNNIAQQIEDAQVLLLADVNQDGLPQEVTLTDVDSLIDSPDIDAVVICSPTDTHADYVERCARAGKHVFCEKPLDLSLDRIEKTLAVLEETDIKLMLGFNRRFDPNFLKLRSLVQDGKVGDLQIVKITSRDPGPPPLTYLQSSGGMFLDMSIHDFDMARYMMGKRVVQVYAEASTLTGGDVEVAGDIDTAVITLRFEDGALAVIDNSRKAIYGYDQRMEVFGSKGMAKVENNAPDTHLYYGKNMVEASLPLNFFMDRYTDSYLAEMRAFVRACIDDTPVPVGAVDGKEAAKIAVAAIRSVRERKPVQID
ncbi:inositol 2-dehydrogenase [Sphingobacterium sp. lm-10]|uniref:inositol 2-dehydrogenase n=1 Tax=Sphingobacterium sp. lm-10 TaxID=2944904 RepID=UPI002021BF63|nr:inositol 2-dehydrogenase [Sphingobacterium sp. lm-10]MCL7986371.1 inositol 2-dehydrogenase [Sphingobacterium sp. lm-10]